MTLLLLYADVIIFLKRLTISFLHSTLDNSTLKTQKNYEKEKMMLIYRSSEEYINLTNSLNCFLFQFPIVLEKHLIRFTKQDHLKSENCTFVWGTQESQIISPVLLFFSSPFLDHRFWTDKIASSKALHLNKCSPERMLWIFIDLQFYN